MGIFDWFKDDAIKLLYKYDLNPDSVVVDVGGYKGNWSINIINKWSN